MVSGHTRGWSYPVGYSVQGMPVACLPSQAAHPAWNPVPTPLPVHSFPLCHSFTGVGRGGRTSQVSRDLPPSTCTDPVTSPPPCNRCLYPSPHIRSIGVSSCSCVHSPARSPPALFPLGPRRHAFPVTRQRILVPCCGRGWGTAEGVRVPVAPCTHRLLDGDCLLAASHLA